MTLLRFPEGHVAAVRSWRRAGPPPCPTENGIDRPRRHPWRIVRDPGLGAVPTKRIWKHLGLK